MGKSQRKFKQHNTAGWPVGKTDSGVKGQDDLDDLESTFEDFGHGFGDDQPDPNVKPKEAAAVTLKSADKRSLTVSFAAAGQCVEKITVQVLPQVKKKVKPDKAFQKFSTSSKVGGRTTVISSDAQKCTEATISELQPNTPYFVRIVLKNPAGEVPGVVAGPFTTTETPPATPSANGSSKASKSKSNSKSSLSEASSAPEKPKTGIEKHVPNGVMSRLGVKVDTSHLKSRLEEEEAKAAAPKLFAVEKKNEQSKIFQALNPQSLYFESRREKAEKEERAVRVSIRGGGRSMNRLTEEEDFGFREVERDEFGNIIQEEESEEEEDFDPKNLPDFGEFQAEMDELRKARAEKQKEHQAELRRKWEAKKKAEEERLQREIEAIEKRQKKEQKALGYDEKFVKEAQRRLEQEVDFGFKFETD
eukprot:m.62551 g.62551  ORF g.62551 m.62551 type:complete len:418 (+) comp13359_c0_seq1:521-1774(+)